MSMLKNWLIEDTFITTKLQVLDYDNVTCILGSFTEPVSTIDPEILCDKKMLDITLTVLGCIVVFMILAGGIYYVNRKRIKSSLIEHGIKFFDKNVEINKVSPDLYITRCWENNIT